MSNYASIQLCIKLEKLSGWKNTEKAWGRNDRRVFITNSDNALFGHDIARKASAYDCGYLLRSFEKADLEWPVDLTYCPHQDGLRNYCATYMELPFSSKKQPPFACADTPEDALTKLAISLFEQNILTK